MSNSENNVDMDESTMNESESESVENTDANPSENSNDEAGNNKSSDSDLVQQLEDAQQHVQEYRDKMLRVQAEMENLRKRTERDISNAHKYANEKFATEILQVKDSLELGLNAEDINVEKLREGTELTLKMLKSIFEKFSIEEIDPQGETFDPNMHEAMTMQESSEHEPNTVLTVVQKGYTLHGRLVRPAMVIVSKAAS